ncbi:hypothetical protein [Arcobacter ellisii]|uniref:Uncharacterized protein n=1 Tax=Arcobacter ellisii TaxID=913109 RepID=A0AA94F873_9BACT|nr:hypothetical protein [Arcobacter ellisii]RXI28319.1 hypothetical protein CP962_14035 [Arcobacter ellisii]
MSIFLGSFQAYHNDIKYINDKKIDFLKNNYDDELKKQGIEEYFNYFNSDISEKNIIEYSSKNIDTKLFDIYQLSSSEKYNYYLGNSKSIKNLQVAFRELIE